METTITVVGGIILSIPPSVSKQSGSDICDSLLLAWLAAKKAAGEKAVQAGDLTDVLGKVGWNVISNSHSSTSSVSLASLSTDLIKDGETDMGNRQTALATLNTFAASASPAAALWTSEISTEAAPVFIFGFVTEGNNPIVKLNSFSAEIPSAFDLMFDTPGTVTAHYGETTLQLNEDVYSGVRSAVADKIKDHLGQIMTTPIN